MSARSALAIAKRYAKKYAEGGDVPDEGESWSPDDNVPLPQPRPAAAPVAPPPPPVDKLALATEAARASSRYTRGVPQETPDGQQSLTEYKPTWGEQLHNWMEGDDPSPGRKLAAKVGTDIAQYAPISGNILQAQAGAQHRNPQEMAVAMLPGAARPAQMAENYATRLLSKFGNDYESMAAHLFDVADRNGPAVADKIFKALPQEAQGKVDPILWELSTDAGHNPWTNPRPTEPTASPRGQGQFEQQPYIPSKEEIISALNDDTSIRNVGDTKPALTVVDPQTGAAYLAETFNKDPQRIAQELMHLSDTSLQNYGHAADIYEHLPSSIRGDVAAYMSKEHAPLPSEPRWDIEAGLSQPVHQDERIASASNAEKYLQQNILPHYEGDFSKFLDHYFAGTSRPDSMMVEPDANGVYFGGKLHDDSGREIGTIERAIRTGPEGKYAYHGYFKLYDSSKQGRDFGKEILSNQMQLYQNMGLDYVKLLANIDVGGYAWAKYGFLPTRWDSVRNSLKMYIHDYYAHKQMPKEDYDHLLKIVNSDDPRALWDVADYPAMAPASVQRDTGATKPLTWGKALLLGQTWDGRLDLKRPEQMERFNSYVNSKKKK